MKNCNFVRIAFCLLGLMAMLLPSGLTLATGSDDGFEQEVDGYHVQLIFDGQPKTGPNEIGIRITDPTGGPLVGAGVEVLPVLAAGEHTVSGTESHGDVQGEHAEVQSETHNQPGEAMENGHSNSPEMEVHGEAGSAEEGHQEMQNESMAAGHSEAEGHLEMEAEVHEETGSHSESKNVLLKTSGEAGFYSGKISFSEPGDWFISVRILLEDEMVEKELSFPVDVIASGPPWGVLSGFFGINLIVVAVAGFLKRKPLAASS
jgi:hypothetical protein